MFLPDKIDLAESKKYILSIRLRPNGFYFSIHCCFDKAIFYQNSITFRNNSNYLKNIEQLLFDYSFFSYNYKRINVICVESETTFVPNEFYSNKMKEDILSFNYITPKQYVISNKIEKQDCRVVFGMNKSVHNFLSRTLLNPHFSSHLSHLILTFYNLHNKSSCALFVNFNDDNLTDLIAFSNGNLILAKTLRATNCLDISYYIQKTWQTLNLNVQTDKLIFAGNRSSHSECVGILKKVVLNTENLSLELPSTLKMNTEEVPTEILNLLCEL